jgi:hypothetical protein
MTIKEQDGGQTKRRCAGPGLATDTCDEQSTGDYAADEEEPGSNTTEWVTGAD